ncbi:ATP-binding protein [Thermophagus sp. OGC60D27]|uniref:ATP-binding protein n=1 Tax=Thermophagus sp. OGC60D27 TaxID=3458415 RepID=UPI004037C718
MMTLEIKKRIIEAIKKSRENYSSDAKMAVALGISSSQFSRITRGDIENVLSDAKWISIARRLNVEISGRKELVTAKTPVFQFVTQQLAACKENSLSGLLCDSADVGKSYAAKWFCRNNKNAAYIDCSQYKTKQKLIRAIAREFGLNHIGRYSDVYDDLVFYLRSVPNPLVVLDEAGDLDYPAFLELKALWNATEYVCGWYMIGADGLRKKIEKNLGNKKVGYTEIFSRYGSRYQKITPDGGEELEKFKRHQVALIAKANGVTNVQQLYSKTQGSLRRIYTEIQKLNNKANA